MNIKKISSDFVIENIKKLFQDSAKKGIKNPYILLIPYFDKETNVETVKGFLCERIGFVAHKKFTINFEDIVFYKVNKLMVSAAKMSIGKDVDLSQVLYHKLSSFFDENKNLNHSDFTMFCGCDIFISGSGDVLTTIFICKEPNNFLELNKRSNVQMQSLKSVVETLSDSANEEDLCKIQDSANQLTFDFGGNDGSDNELDE